MPVGKRPTIFPVPGPRLVQRGSLVYIIHFILIPQAPGPQCNPTHPLWLPAVPFPGGVCFLSAYPPFLENLMAGQKLTEGQVLPIPIGRSVGL